MHRFRRVVVAFVAVIAASLLSCTAAQAAPNETVIGKAATALQSNSIWVDPGVPNALKLTDNQVSSLRQMIASGKHHDVFIAVVPTKVSSEIGGKADNLEPAVEKATGKPGVYAVASISKAGKGIFRAGGTSDASVTNVQPIADAAWGKHGQGLYATLADFVKRVQDAPVAGTTTTKTRETKTTTTKTAAAAKHHSYTWLWVLLGIVVLGLGGWFIWNRTGLNGRKRTQRGRLDRLEKRAVDRSLNSDTIDYTLGDIDSLRDQLKAARTGDEVDAVENEIDKLENPRSDDEPETVFDTATSSRYSDYDGDDTRRTYGYSEVGRKGGSSARTGTTQSRPRPTQGATIVNNYNTNYGSGYGGAPWQGYYPGYGYGLYPQGYGYYDFGGNFVAGMLLAELWGSDRDYYNSWAYENGAPGYDDSTANTVTETTETTTETYGEDPDSVAEAAEEVGGGGDFDEGTDGSGDAGDAWGVSSTGYGSDNNDFQSDDADSYEADDYGDDTDDSGSSDEAPADDFGGDDFGSDSGGDFGGGDFGGDGDFGGGGDY